MVTEMKFKTTDAQRAKLPEIIKAMDEAHLNWDFIEELAMLANYDQGVFELMEIWYEDIPERENTEQYLFDALN